jgi:hypothetical protein
MYYAERFKTELPPSKSSNIAIILGTDPPCSYRKKTQRPGGHPMSKHPRQRPVEWDVAPELGTSSTGWTTGCFHGVFHKVPPLLKKNVTWTCNGFTNSLLDGFAGDIMGYIVGISPAWIRVKSLRFQRSVHFWRAHSLWAKNKKLQALSHGLTLQNSLDCGSMWVFHEIFPILKLTLSSSGKFLPCSDGAMWKCCGNSDCEFELGDVRGCQGNGSAPKI